MIEVEPGFWARPPLHPLLWVAGTRHGEILASHPDRLSQIIDQLDMYDDYWTLITGGADGVDEFAENHWRHYLERPYVGVPAKWKTEKRAAGPRRNLRIAELWQPDRLLAFPGGRGTESAIESARKEGIEVVRYAW